MATDDLDRDLHKAADKNKQDLQHGKADSVPTGSEKAPPPRVDPFAARKALFDKAKAVRDAKPDEGGDPDMVDAMRREAGEPTAKPAAPKPDKPLPSPEGVVTIRVEGRGDITVAQRDIDREGGTANYLRRLQLDDEQAALAREHADVAKLRRQIAQEARQPEPTRPRAAGQDDPAAGGARPAPRETSRDNATLDEQAERLARMIYEGDADDAKKAIRELLTPPPAAAPAYAPAPSPAAAPAPVPSEPSANPVVEAINKAINAMASTEYADVCRDPVATAATFEKFKQLVALPENRDRRAVDVARDACEWGREKFSEHPRHRVVEAKRGLFPSTLAAGVTDATDTEDEPMSPAQVVQMIAARRNFNRPA